MAGFKQTGNSKIETWSWEDYWKMRSKSDQEALSIIRGQRKEEERNDLLVQLSKFLSHVIRHNGPRLGIQFDSDGFAYLDEVLKQSYDNRWYVDDVKKLLEKQENEEYKRFTLITEESTGRLKIKCNLFHTFDFEDYKLELVTRPEDYPVLIHGTFSKYFHHIKESGGLSKVRRAGIHFTVKEPMGDNLGVIRGLHRPVDFYIYVDIVKAMKDGIEFFRSAVYPDLIVTPGNSQGYLETKYFSKILEIQHQRTLLNAMDSLSLSEPQTKHTTYTWDNYWELKVKTEPTYNNPKLKEIRRKEERGDPLVRLSKFICCVIRHKAEEYGIEIDSDGFAYVDEVLQKQGSYQHWTVANVQQLLQRQEHEEYKRFTLITEESSGQLKIKCNLFHTYDFEDLKLELITRPDDYPVVIHGTFNKNIRAICETGLHKMRRQGIHFIFKEPNDPGVIKGLRREVDYYIYVNIKRAMNDGVQFFRSGVDPDLIVSPGNSEGYLDGKYFGSVTRVNRQRPRASGETMLDPNPVQEELKKNVKPAVLEWRIR